MEHLFYTYKGNTYKCIRECKMKVGIDKSAITQKAIKVLNQESDGYLDSIIKEEETKK